MTDVIIQSRKALFYSSQNREFFPASIDGYEANKETGIVKTLDKLLQMEK